MKLAPAFVLDRGEFAWAAGAPPCSQACALTVAAIVVMVVFWDIRFVPG